LTIVTNSVNHPQPRHVSNAAGLSFDFLANGAIRLIAAGELMLNLFLGNELEGGPANLWLRRHGGPGSSGEQTLQATPLLGPQSPLHLRAGVDAYQASGQWQGLQIDLALRLASDQAAWFWHVRVENLGADSAGAELDVICVQDIGLSAYGAIRLNEYYVSHYIDLTPLEHASQGRVLAARQNLAQKDGKHPWAVLGSLRHGVSFATDGLQVQGLAARVSSGPGPGVLSGLPGQRLQHEHALLGVQDQPLTLAAGASATFGFFGSLLADHPAATGEADLAHVDALLRLPEAQPPEFSEAVAGTVCALAPRSLFASAPLLPSLDLTAAELDQLFAGQRRHEERVAGDLLSFSQGAQTHVVLRAKELLVQRPHGHILRSGHQLLPDESALTSTVWMGGVFHSMLTQGHVSVNRCLSTARSWLNFFRSQGQRVFVQQAGSAGWQQLGLPSAFAMEPTACRWIYKHEGGLIELRSAAEHSPHALSLDVRVLSGLPVRVLVSHHIALGGDDGSAAVAALWRSEAGGVRISAPLGSELAARFPAAADFDILPAPDTIFERIGGAEMLFPAEADAVALTLPFVCATSAMLEAGKAGFGLRLHGRLLADASAQAGELALPAWTLPAGSPQAAEASRLTDILPWYRHNALIHYLSPRGLEQFSGGGWGTRDVCQGPLEMLLALDQPAPVRDLLERVFAAQNADGDWPQWFMFFERERHVRAGDSHGDVVFWPLLGLARYLLASGDASLLDLALPYYAKPDTPAEQGSVWQHVQRALKVIEGRHIEGTALVAYGHGDWNDSLQPADPALRERLCSAWTVTLHCQMLNSLAQALRFVGRGELAPPLQAQAARVQADFQRLLVVGEVLTGYALFPPNEAPQYLLHPQDTQTGVGLSLLPMMHAILADMLSPEQAHRHLALMQTALSGPDGARLFDKPMPYRGGPQRLFQRAETSAFFGREIGVMYMHAHLRFAEMLAHLGQAEAFFEALGKAHPLGLQALVPQANLRQANCYFSSSDAAFADRYQASADYAQVSLGQVALDGGWRIYSSGPGIALGLVVNRFLGLRRERGRLILDPVMPASLDGLRGSLALLGRLIEIEYRLGSHGCGPTRLELNGQALEFSRGANPYRLGAAELDVLGLCRQLAADRNRLVIWTD
jgi:cellobiose phosphorylase